MRIEDNTPCVVETKYPWIYDFCEPGTEAETLEKAEAKRLEDIALYSRFIVEYPDNMAYWKDRLKEAEGREYKIMTYVEFEAHQRHMLLAGEPEEISEERFYEQFNVLPPIKWVTIGDVEMFCLCEMWTGSYTNQYAHDHKTGKFYTKMVDSADRDTWIHKYLRGEVIPF